MPDMLVKLYDLPEAAPPVLDKLRAYGIEIRRALVPDKNKIVNWVRATFSDAWASECEVAFYNKPVSCFIAVENKKNVVGFACYEGIGKALLLKCLHAMREAGYAYTIIGGVTDAVEFYTKAVRASIIEESNPGIYRGLIGFD